MARCPLKLATKLNLNHCCVAWSDLLYIPAQYARQMKHLLRTGRHLVNEAAVPTTLSTIPHPSVPRELLLECAVERRDRVGVCPPR